MPILTIIFYRICICVFDDGDHNDNSLHAITTEPLQLSTRLNIFVAIQCGFDARKRGRGVIRQISVSSQTIPTDIHVPIDNIHV